MIQFMDKRVTILVMKIVPRQSSLVCEFFSQEYEAFIATPTIVTMAMFA